MATATIPSPLGKLTLIATEDALVSIQMGSAKAVTSGKNRILNKASKQLAQFFSGKRKSFSVPISFSGTPFQKRVWAELFAIPYGQVRTYGEIAKRMSRPNAFRAVGNAIGKNRLPILIPCHRVVASGGKLGGFTGGISKKVWLLELERGRS